MTHKAPGKSHRQGITLPKLLRMFPDDATAEKWFTEQRWGDEPVGMAVVVLTQRE